MSIRQRGYRRNASAATAIGQRIAARGNSNYQKVQLKKH
jgi:ABC-type phosphonate transport system ATPase subunit